MARGSYVEKGGGCKASSLEREPLCVPLELFQPSALRQHILPRAFVRRLCEWKMLSIIPEGGCWQIGGRGVVMGNYEFQRHIDCQSPGPRGACGY